MEKLTKNEQGQWQLVAEQLEKKAPEGVDPEKHERCVMDVKEQGHNVGSAHAICTASMKKKEDEFTKEKLTLSENGQWDIEPVKTK